MFYRPLTFLFLCVWVGCWTVFYNRRLSLAGCLHWSCAATPSWCLVMSLQINPAGVYATMKYILLGRLRMWTTRKVARLVPNRPTNQKKANRCHVYVNCLHTRRSKKESWVLGDDLYNVFHRKGRVLRKKFYLLQLPGAGCMWKS